MENKVVESVSEYFSRIMTIVNSMRNCGEQMPDVKVVEKVLRSLIDKFNYIVCSIEESKDIDNLSVDELQSSLTVHEQKFRKKESEEQALKVSAETKTFTRGRGRNSGGGRGRGKGRHSFNRDMIECYKCHKLAHFQYECPTLEKEANYIAEFDETEELLLMTHVDTNEVRKEEIWFLNSGCSNHMSGIKQCLMHLMTHLDML